MSFDDNRPCPILLHLLLLLLLPLFGNELGSLGGEQRQLLFQASLFGPDTGLLLLQCFSLGPKNTCAVLGRTRSVSACISPPATRQAVPACPCPLLLLQSGHLGEQLEITGPGRHCFLEEIVLLDHHLLAEVLLVTSCFDLLAKVEVGLCFGLGTYFSSLSISL